MRNLNEKRICGRVAALMASLSLMTASCFAAGPNFANVAAPIVELLNSFMAPLLAIVVAAGGLYCILLGVKYAKAEEPQEREKAKSNLKNAVIGFVLIFVLVVAMNLMLKPLTDWVNSYVKGTF